MSTPKITALTATVKTYFDLVASRLVEKVPRVRHSAQSDTLSGSTVVQMADEVNESLTIHIANRSNPHQIRPGHLGSYSTAEVADLLSRRGAIGLIPVTRYGTLDYDDPGVQVGAGWVVEFTQEQPLILNGYYAMMPVTSIDLASVQSDPSNQTFYVYVDMTSGVASYLVHHTAIDELPMRLQIGTITTDTTGIGQIQITKQTLFGGYRLSTTPRGQAIPHTSGLPSQEAHLDLGWL